MSHIYSLAEGSIGADEVEDHILNLKFVMARKRNEIHIILFDGGCWGGSWHSDTA